MHPCVYGLAKRLEVADEISFVNRLPQDELFKRYPDFDVLLFPSLHDCVR